MEYNIAFFGKFSSGKSTLINSLLGRKVVPELASPTHIPPVKISYGKNYRIKFGVNGNSKQFFSLKSFKEEMGEVSSNTNSYFDVEVDHPYLRSGLVIWDTPGNNDPDEEYENLALNFLDKMHGIINKAYFLATDSVLNKQDIELVKMIDSFGIDLVILNSKADRRNDKELEQIIDIYDSSLLQHLGKSFQILPVAPRVLWKESITEIFQNQLMHEVALVYEQKILKLFNDGIYRASTEISNASKNEAQLIEKSFKSISTLTTKKLDSSINNLQNEVKQGQSNFASAISEVKNSHSVTFMNLEKVFIKMYKDLSEKLNQSNAEIDKATKHIVKITKKINYSLNLAIIAGLILIILLSLNFWVMI